MKIIPKLKKVLDRRIVQRLPWLFFIFPKPLGVVGLCSLAGVSILGSARPTQSPSPELMQRCGFVLAALVAVFVSQGAPFWFECSLLGLAFAVGRLWCWRDFPVFLGVALPLSFLALAQFAGVLPTMKSQVWAFIGGGAIHRSTGFYPHTSALSVAGLFILLIGFLEKKVERAYWLGGLGLIIAATTLSRSAYVLGVLIALAWVIRGWRRKPVLLASGVAAIVAVAAMLLNPRLAELGQLRGAQGQRLVESFAATELLATHPLGISSEELARTYPIVFERWGHRLGIADREFGVAPAFHNGFLIAGVNYGLLALLLYGLVVFAPALLLRSRSGAFVSGILGFWSCTDTILYTDVVPLYGLWLGSLSCLENRSERTKLPTVPWRRGIVVLLFAASVYPVLYAGRAWTLTRVARETARVYVDNRTGEPAEVVVRDEGGRAQSHRVGVERTLWMTQPLGSSVCAAGECRTLRPGRWLWVLRGESKLDYVESHYRVTTSTNPRVEKILVPVTFDEMTARTAWTSLGDAAGGAEFCDEEPPNFAHRFKKAKQGWVLTTPASIFHRPGCRYREEFRCHEPFYLLFGRWDISICEDLSPSSYGMSALRANSRAFWKKLRGDQ